MIIYDCYNRPYIDPLRKAIIENWDLNNKERKFMIKVNELRIGNYILFKEQGKGKGKIGQIKPGDFSRLAGDDPEESEYHPIPLTPEWLERCGFKDGQINYSYHTQLLIEPYETVSQGVFPGKWRVTLIDTVPYSIGKQLEYVHQL